NRIKRGAPQIGVDGDRDRVIAFFFVLAQRETAFAENALALAVIDDVLGTCAAVGGVFGLRLDAFAGRQQQDGHNQRKEKGTETTHWTESSVLDVFRLRYSGKNERPGQESAPFFSPSSPQTRKPL